MCSGAVPFHTRRVSAAALIAASSAASSHLLADMEAVSGPTRHAQENALDRLEAALGRELADRLVAALAPHARRRLESALTPEFAEHIAAELAKDRTRAS
jgi:hypothetical protein